MNTSDIGETDIVEMRKDSSTYNNFTAPGVKMHCLFGTNIDSVESLDFGTIFNPNPDINYGNGDGEINYRSLVGCTKWENTPEQGNHKIHQKDFPGLNHVNILDNPATLNYILEQV